MEDIDLLVAGAQEGSLGEAIAEQARLRGAVVRTIGLHKEDHNVDLRVRTRVPYRAQHLVTTIGINNQLLALQEHMRVNVQVNLDLLDWWMKEGRYTGRVDVGQVGTDHFVAISSNSAHIARRNSMAYCVSKAALSMAIRVRAREEAHRKDVAIYCYEPGWIEGTPMSKAIAKRLGKELKPMHRMPHGDGVSRHNLARMIVSNLMGGGMELNGACIRIDGGEQ